MLEILTHLRVGQPLASVFVTTNVARTAFAHVLTKRGVCTFSHESKLTQLLVCLDVEWRFRAWAIALQPLSYSLVRVALGFSLTPASEREHSSAREHVVITILVTKVTVHESGAAVQRREAL